MQPKFPGLAEALRPRAPHTAFLFRFRHLSSVKLSNLGPTNIAVVGGALLRVGDNQWQNQR